MLNLVEFYIVNSKTGEHETDIWKVVNKLFDVIRLCCIWEGVTRDKDLNERVGIEGEYTVYHPS